MIKNKKIIVIADDFTGAAEIGGIGLRHGLKVAIETEPINNDADLLVIATDTRSMHAKDAASYIKALTKKLLEFDPLFIYKKIDSVLRGNITAELEAQLITEEKKRAIIVAANPVFNRIIKNGYYFINGVELHKTCFSQDSQYPISSNQVLDILSPGSHYEISSVKTENTIPDKGLLMCDVETLDDLNKWTTYYDKETLFAGASGFFDALLTKAIESRPEYHEVIPKFGTKTMFVLGSYYPKDDETLLLMKEQGHQLYNMPLKVYENTDINNTELENWTKDIVDGIQRNEKVIISSLYPKSNDPEASKRIKTTIAGLVKKVFKNTSLDEILIEGGSTASEVLSELNIKKLTPVQELGAGVIRMKVNELNGLCLTTKPGSYAWPESVWLPNNIKELNKNITTSNH
jgi:uncharacterized protein YgbK (DUF1537 family)